MHIIQCNTTKCILYTIFIWLLLKFNLISNEWFIKYTCYITHVILGKVLFYIINRLPLSFNESEQIFNNINN